MSGCWGMAYDRQVSVLRAACDFHVPRLYQAYVSSYYSYTVLSYVLISIMTCHVMVSQASLVCPGFIALESSSWDRIFLSPKHCQPPSYIPSYKHMCQHKYMHVSTLFCISAHIILHVSRYHFAMINIHANQQLTYNVQVGTTSYNRLLSYLLCARLDCDAGQWFNAHCPQ